MNRQVLLFVVLIAVLGATGLILFKKFNPATAGMLVVRNTSAQPLKVQVGTAAAGMVAANATAQDAFVEGMMVKVWPGEGGNGPSVGWRIYKITGELALQYADGVVTVSGEGLEQTALNNGPGANAGNGAPAPK